MEISMSGLTPHTRMEKFEVLGWDLLTNLGISEGKMKIFQCVLKKWSNVQQN